MTNCYRMKTDYMTYDYVFNLGNRIDIEKKIKTDSVGSDELKEYPDIPQFWEKVHKESENDKENFWIIGIYTGLVAGKKESMYSLTPVNKKRLIKMNPWIKNKY